MPLTKEQLKEAKSQLLQQIQHLPPEQKVEAEEQINSLSEEALEEMLKQQSSQQKIFRLIIEEKIPSVKIEDTPHAIAVLSTKSLSKGHTIIIPKSPLQKEQNLPKEIHELSEKISKKILESLKPKTTSILSQRAFGEVILNIIPIYDKPINLNSPTKDVPIEELEEIKKQINVIIIHKSAPKETIKMEKPAPQKPLKLKRRIP